MTQIHLPNSAVINYEYDNARRLKAVSNALGDATRTVTYSYDQVDRLSSESRNNHLHSYMYDEVGNRSQKTIINNTDPSNPVQMQDAFSYDTVSNRLKSVNGQLLTYDLAGNITQRDFTGALTIPSALQTKLSITYDATNRMETASLNNTLQANYKYNAYGQRVAKQLANGNSAVFHFNLAGQLLSETEYNSSGVELINRSYIWLAGKPVAMATTNASATTLVATNLSYLHFDHLNSPRLATNSTQQIVWRWQSDAFGMGFAEEDVDGDGVSVDIALRFPGQIFDDETGLHYNYFRDYDPSLGRYVQSDPIGLEGGLNTYGYVGGNPLSNIDPSGLDCIALNGSVTCTAPGGGPTVTFPRPQEWPDIMNSNSSNYHKYNISVPLNGASASCVMQGMTKNPTPGNPASATTSGTSNNATPSTAQGLFDSIDFVSSFGSDSGGYNNSPVISYVRNDGTVVVNVTQPGHPLHPGYVARTIGGSTVNNYGEGLGWLQGKYSPAAPFINGVWDGQTNGIINSCECSQ